jgi:hypothetical protein
MLAIPLSKGQVTELPIVTALLLLIFAATASSAMRSGIWTARVTSGFQALEFGYI